MIGNGTDTLSEIEEAELTGGSGNNTIDASDFLGSVFLEGKEGNDTLYGGEGDDFLFGDEGNDMLYGGDGDDNLWDFDGNNTLNGEAGDDSFSTGSGNNTLNGGAGNDLLFSTTFANGNITLTNTSLTDVGNNTLSGIESAFLSGGSGNNTIDASGFTLGSVELDGGLGDDTLYGGDGNDTLYGDNNDSLYGGNYYGVVGDDILNGGDGFDTAYYSSDSYNFNSASITVNLATGIATSDDEGNDTLSDIEGVNYGGYGNSTLIGNKLDNVLTGGYGNDALNGGAGNDILNGGASNDTLAGGSGNDFLNGESGNDVLYGDSGNDTLTGDEGNDFFIGGFGTDTLTGNQGNDTFRFNFPNRGLDIITDFSPTADTIEVNADNFGGELQPGAITVDQFFLGSSAQDAEDRFLYNQSTGALFFDSDGSGSAAKIQFATLSNEPLINRFDIVVV